MRKAFDSIIGIFKPAPLTLSNGKKVKRPFRSGLVVSLVLLFLIYLTMGVTEFKVSVLINRGYRFLDILKKMIPPNWSYLPKVWVPMFETIGMSIFGTFLAALIGVPIAYYSAVNMNQIV